MAEQVQAVMESMIPVFEDLQCHNIFTQVYFHVFKNVLFAELCVIGRSK